MLTKAIARLGCITLALSGCVHGADMAQATGQAPQSLPGAEAPSRPVNPTSPNPAKPKPVIVPSTPTVPPGIKENPPGGDAGLEARVLPVETKPKVAVVAFSYGTVMTQVQAVFGTNQDIGRGISALLVRQLVADGKYRVVEGPQLAILSQDFSSSERADSTTLAKIGRLLGVDAIIVGDVTQFGREDKNRSPAGGGIGLGRLGAGGLTTRKPKAVVELTARLVDVNTGEILASATGHGESARSATDLAGVPSSAKTGTGVGMESSSFNQTILGEAVSASVAALAHQLDQDAKTSDRALEVKGLVADVSGKKLILNIGTSTGVHTGDKLAVVRIGHEIRDSLTGKSISNVEAPIGSAVITSVDEHSAEAMFTGEKEAKVGDSVRVLQQPK